MIFSHAEFVVSPIDLIFSVCIYVCVYIQIGISRSYIKLTAKVFLYNMVVVHRERQLSYEILFSRDVI